MKDCKHFKSNCAVCWVKLSQGVKVEDAPIRGDEGTEKYIQDCIKLAMLVSERNINDSLRSNI